MPHCMQASLCCGSKHYPNLKGQQKASFSFQHILICVTRNVGEKKRALSHSSNCALGLEVTQLTSIRMFLTRTNHGGPTTSHPMTRGPGSKILLRAWKSKSQKDLENSTSDHQERREERRRIRHLSATGEDMLKKISPSVADCTLIPTQQHLPLPIKSCKFYN